jgi:putative peptidoglycan lipid II flippase
LLPSPPNLHRHLIHSTLAVLGLTLLAKLSGAFKEVVMASSLGTSALADQFVFAFLVATWPASMLASVLTIALTPVLTKLFATGATGNSQQTSFVAQLWCACICFAAAVALLSWLSFPYLSPVARAAGPQMGWAVGVVSFIACLSALAGTVLTSQGRQIGALLEGVPSLVLAVLLLLAVWQQADSLVYGMVLGMGLQLALLLAVQTRSARPPRLQWPQAHAAWKAFFSGLGYVTAGYVLLAAAAMVGLYVASHLGQGSLASLNYASRITALMTGLLITAVNRVAIVHFCSQTASLGSPWRAWGGMVSVFTLTAAVASAVLVLLAPQIVALLFERGEFDNQETAVVARLVRWHISQLAPALACVVLSAYLSATGGFRTIFVGCLLCFLSETTSVLLGASLWGMDAIAAAPMLGRVVMLSYFLLILLRERDGSTAGSTVQASTVTGNAALHV